MDLDYYYKYMLFFCHSLLCIEKYYGANNTEALPEQEISPFFSVSSHYASKPGPFKINNNAEIKL